MRKLRNKMLCSFGSWVLKTFAKHLYYLSLMLFLLHESLNSLQQHISNPMQAVQESVSNILFTTLTDNNYCTMWVTQNCGQFYYCSRPTVQETYNWSAYSDFSTTKKYERKYNLYCAHTLQDCAHAHAIWIDIIRKCKPHSTRMHTLQ